MSDPFFPIERVRLFATDGAVFRAFDHLIAARMGTLLLVPMHLVTGRCDAVVDGCPVPWEEVYSILEYPPINPFTNPSKWSGMASRADQLQQLQYLGVDPDACEMDHITPMVNGRETVLRLIHPCGLRYAVVVD
jgi:hypothetical protein